MSNPQPRTWTPGTARQVIEAAYEAGVRIFDSARAYATLDDPVHSDRITAVMQGAARLLNGPVEFPVADASPPGSGHVENLVWSRTHCNATELHY